MLIGVWLVCLMPLDLLNLCVNVLLVFCKRINFIFHAGLNFSNSPCQLRQRDLEWCEEMRACQKGLIYFYTALLLSNAVHIFEIINPNVISFLSSISAASVNHSWRFFSYFKFNKNVNCMIIFLNWDILMGVIMDAKSLQKLVRPLPAGVVLHVLKYSCFFFFFLC